MKTFPFLFVALSACAGASFSLLPLHAQDATLPPLGHLSPQKEACLTIKVQNCLMDAIVNITDTSTGTTVFRKVVDRGDRHSFSLQWWGKEGAYRISIVPANAETRSLFKREIVRDVALNKGEHSTLHVDVEEKRPADMAPLPTEEQIDRFCQGDTRALQEYLGDPNRVLLVYVYEVTMEPNRNERVSRLYGLVRTTKVMVLQSTDPAIRAGERLEWSHALETGDRAGEILSLFKAKPFEPTLMYITNPHKVGEGQLHGETGLNMFPMQKRSVYLYLRANHTIQGIPA